MSVDLNRTSTGTVEYMKLGILLPILTAVPAIAITWALTGCKSAHKPKSADSTLPASCTLLAMSPEQREAHQHRLENLRKASRLLRETADGFTFSVDLCVLPAYDLAAWMENEQKCCSFLRMTSHVNESKTLAEVQVNCPTDLRHEVMRTFGLNTEQQSDRQGI